RLHRAANACIEVGEEVFLRRQHELDSVSSKGSSWSLHGRVLHGQQPGGSLVFSCRPRKRLLHNYRDTTEPSVVWFHEKAHVIHGPVEAWIRLHENAYRSERGIDPRPLDGGGH